MKLGSTDVPAITDVLAHLPDPALLLAADGRCVGASLAAGPLFSHGVDGRTVEELLPEIAERLRNGDGADAGSRILEPTLERHGVIYEAHVLPAEGHRLLLLRPADLSRGLDPLRELLATAGGTPEALHSTLDRFCLWIEQQQPGVLCSILLYDAAGHYLRVGGSPSLPPAYNALQDQFPVGPANASCGTAAHRREPVIVEEIATDPLWATVKQAALQHGLLACWSQPILSTDGAVLGTFAVYRRTAGGPSARERAFIGGAARLVGLLIERMRQRGELEVSRDELRSREAHYRRIVEENCDVVCLIDPAAMVTYVSATITSMTGFLPSDVVGCTIGDFVHPDDLPLAQQRMAARLRGQPALDTLVIRLRTTDGGWRFVDAKTNLLPGLPGEPTRLLVNMRDLSERFRQEDALRDSERRLRQLFDNLTGLLFLLDTEGRILEVSDTAARTGGFSKTEVTGHALWNIPPLARIAASARIIESAVEDARQGHSTSGEVAFLAGTGDHRLARFRLTPLTDDQGGVRFVLGEAVDITEQRRAERALADSERLFKSISDQSPSLVCLFDLQAASFIYCSAAYERLLGRSPAEIVGLGTGAVDAMVAPEDRPPVEELFARLATAQDEEVVELEFRMRHVDGTRRDVIARCVVFSREPDGAPKLILAVNDDVTERRVFESRLRQGDKMEALGTLAGGVAHDFNNLLAVIMSYGELVIGELSPGSTLSEDVGQILAASRRAKDLVRQILAFSRKSDLARDVFDLDDVLQETGRFLRASLPATIEIRQSIPPKPRRLHGDANQIQQVLINLGVNAEYAMRSSGGGVLAIELDRLTLKGSAARAAALAPGPYHRLRIRDTGPGMTAGVLARVFEPFFTTKPVGEGTGMGLAAAHGIVTQHGGVIRASSVEGEGTTFEILLPDAGGPVPAAETHVDQPELPSKVSRVLVVDDEPAIVRVMAKLLKRFGFDPTVTDDPVDALARFEAAPDEFDCVITDLTMPKLSGDQLARRILAVRPQVPVILCTGFSADFTASAVEQLGVAAFLNKPVEPAELIATLTRVLANRTG